MKPPYAIGSVPSLSGHAVAYRWRSLPRVRRHRASKPQGSSERVLPWQITMDQLIFAPLSHTHYWYEVGMLKVLPIFVKCRITCLSATLRELGKRFGSLVMTLVDEQHIRQSSVSVAWMAWMGSTPDSRDCSSNSTRRHRLDADKFPMFSVGWTWQEFCRDLNSCWFQSKKAQSLCRYDLAIELLPLLFHTPCRNPQLAARTETRLNVSCRVSVLTADVPGQTFQPTSSSDGVDARSKYCGRLYTQKYLPCTLHPKRTCTLPPIASCPHAAGLSGAKAAYPPSLITLRSSRNLQKQSLPP